MNLLVNAENVKFNNGTRTIHVPKSTYLEFGGVVSPFVGARFSALVVSNTLQFFALLSTANVDGRGNC